MSLFDRLFRRRQVYDDLSDEVRSHLEERIDALMAQGMSRADAASAARRAFGNVTNVVEQGRDVWQWPTAESVAMDARYALRQLRRAPVLSATIVLTLAIGIAATTTVFSWARSVLLNPLPGANDAGRVMALETTTSSGSWTPTSWLDYRDFRRYLKSFDGLAAAYPMGVALGDGTRAERHPAELVSANFFDVMGVAPALGRTFPPGDYAGSQPTIVIGYNLWKTRFQGDSSIRGRVVQVNGFPFSIIGVAPPGFHGSMPGEEVDLWVPAGMLGQIVPTGSWWLDDRGTRTFRVFARLSDGVTFDAARAEVESFATRMAKANGDVSKGMGGRLMPVWQSHWGLQDALRAPIGVLLAACGLVMLIVCANGANLLLARATGRRRELTLRMALGAPRTRLLRQLLTEASVLALSGAALGLLCTFWLSRSLRFLLPSFSSRAVLAPHVDGQVLALAIALAAVVTILAGIAPAVLGSRENAAEAFAEGGRGSVGGTRTARMRAAFVVAEMALAVVALVGAGVFYDAFRQARALSPGFSAKQVAMGSVSITLAGYDSAHGDAFLRDVSERLARAPGVTAASYTDYVPLSLGSGSWEDLRVEGYTPEPSENMKLFRAAIGPDYFKTLGIPLIAGRDFTADDDSAHTAVMIVNEAFVRRFMHDHAALGVRVHGWGRWFTIVGVAHDSKNYRVTEPPTPFFFVPVRQVFRPENGYTFLVRTAGSVDEAVRSISQAVKSVDPSVPTFRTMPLADYIEGPLKSQETATQLLGILAVVASLLAAIGLYGVLAYMVAQRTKEIGVRIALGAQTADVLRMVGVQVAALLLVGLAVGLAVGAGAVRVLAATVGSLGTVHTTVFAFAAAVMTIVAVMASGIPARRSTRIDPVIALRGD
ncbi:MAG TPA: ABC transporter permease [Gemmatimonadaceae bacterium]|nr:ABC transporter permease [Gemmatimonadaceae bacterium]